MTSTDALREPELPPEILDVRPGVRLGRYEILLGIAQGGMARVWAAKQYGQRGFAKTVVIKTILPTLAADREFENMFLDEARVAASVHHPNVCEIFDLGEEHGVLYLAMEWVNGESLARVIKPPSDDGSPSESRGVDPRVAARIIADAARGLHAAHELSDHTGNRLDVVHRDVSPQNILVSIDGNVKVTDFGVAKALGGLHEATMAGQVKGKAAYMSPEQAAGGRVDRRSDVFALGICLYEASTGIRPFGGPNAVAILKEVLECSYRRPSELVPGYPRELEHIVLRAMAADPAQRFPTADRMRVALEEWLARSGPIVTEARVGSLVRERVGKVVQERHGHIRRMMASSSADITGELPLPQSSSITSPSNASHLRVVLPATPAQGSAVIQVMQQPASQTHSVLLGAFAGVAAGTLLFVAAGVTWLSMTGRLGQRPEAATAAAATTQVRTASATLRLEARKPNVGVSYTVDGRPLTNNEVPRPQAGSVLVVTASAAGFSSEQIRLDANSPELIDVFLVEAVAPTTSASAAPSAAPSASAAAVPTVAAAAPTPTPAPPAAAPTLVPISPTRAARAAEPVVPKKPTAEKPAPKKPAAKRVVVPDPF